MIKITMSRYRYEENERTSITSSIGSGSGIEYKQGRISLLVVKFLYKDISSRRTGPSRRVCIRRLFFTMIEEGKNEKHREG